MSVLDELAAVQRWYELQECYDADRCVNDHDEDECEEYRR